MQTIKCDDCGHLPTPLEASSCGTGYAVYHEGGLEKYRCYECSNKLEVESLKHHDKWLGYISMDGTSWITWAGGILGEITHWGEFNSFSRERRYIRVVDVHGNEWHGTGAAGMYAMLRKCKASKC